MRSIRQFKVRSWGLKFSLTDIFELIYGIENFENLSYVTTKLFSSQKTTDLVTIPPPLDLVNYPPPPMHVLFLIYIFV